MNEKLHVSVLHRSSGLEVAPEAVFISPLVERPAGESVPLSERIFSASSYNMSSCNELVSAMGARSSCVGQRRRDPSVHKITSKHDEEILSRVLTHWE
jgi:hypothetical protein